MATLERVETLSLKRLADAGGEIVRIHLKREPQAPKFYVAEVRAQLPNGQAVEVKRHTLNIYEVQQHDLLKNFIDWARVEGVSPKKVGLLNAHVFHCNDAEPLFDLQDRAA
ncbi:hypothetical protein [Nesterenkonia rhizosphaerae]